MYCVKKELYRLSYEHWHQICALVGVEAFIVWSSTNKRQQQQKPP